jgi:hypothetical protein
MKTKLNNLALALLFGTCVASSFGADAPIASDTSAVQASGDDMGELAKKLNNPTASLISVPLQNNFDFGGGPNDDGFQYKLNVQPVIPFKVNEDWKILSRTILPYYLSRESHRHEQPERFGGYLADPVVVTRKGKERGRDRLGARPRVPVAHRDR